MKKSRKFRPAGLWFFQMCTDVSIRPSGAPA